MSSSRSSSSNFSREGYRVKKMSSKCHVVGFWKRGFRRASPGVGGESSGYPRGEAEATHQGPISLRHSDRDLQARAAQTAPQNLCGARWTQPGSPSLCSLQLLSLAAAAGPRQLYCSPAPSPQKEAANPFSQPCGTCASSPPIPPALVPLDRRLWGSWEPVSKASLDALLLGGGMGGGERWTETS